MDRNVPDSEITQSHYLTAKRYYSGFELAHDTYNAISAASDGKIYYVLSSESYERGGQMYVYDPETDQTRFIADLTEVCGESGKKAIPQGKSHVRFYESQGKLYFVTHIGVYELIDGMERLPRNLPDGYALYPGGHILAYTLATGTFEDLATAPDGEGLITMTLDRDRGHIYALSWPMGYLLHYNLHTGRLINAGLTCGRGEAGTVGDDYRVICRSMFVDARDGALYLSTAEGDVITYQPDSGILEKVNDLNLAPGLRWPV